MSSINEIWDKACEDIQGRISPVSYSTWIADITPVCIDSNVLILQSSNEVVRTTLNKLYTNMVTEAVNRSGGIGLSVRFVLPSEVAQYRVESYSPSVESNEIRLNPKYTFDTFVIGSSNDLAHAASLAVAENPGGAYNPLFIYGGVGLGKTHLMHAIGHFISEKNPDANIIYVTSETFTNEFIQSIQDNTNHIFRNRYRKADVLMIDDIQFIATRERTQEEFFNTFNDLMMSGKQIVISSDRPPRALNGLPERLISRFEGGFPADIQPPDIETRTAILKKKAIMENIEIDNEVLEFIANRINSNIRQLEGALTRVVAYASLKKRPLDVNICDEALKDIFPGNERRRVTISLVQQVIADYYDIEVEDLISQRRTMDVTYPRQIAMYIAKEMTDESLKSIGKSFGGRHYSTVINACDNVKKDMEENNELKLLIEDLIRRVKK